MTPFVTDKKLNLLRILLSILKLVVQICKININNLYQ